MKRPKNKKEGERLVRAIAILFDELEPETPEEIDAALRDAGYDPDELGARMEAAANCALAKAHKQFET